MAVKTLVGEYARLGKHIERDEQSLLTLQNYIKSLLARIPPLLPVKERSAVDDDEGLLKLAYSHKEFSYLENPEEDIYSLSDGTPL